MNKEKDVSFKDTGLLISYDRKRFITESHVRDSGLVCYEINIYQKNLSVSVKSD